MASPDEPQEAAPATSDPPMANNFKGVTTVPSEKTDPSGKKSSKGSIDRDATLARLDTDKKWAFIKAWEESEKIKVDNRAQKKASKVTAWENSKQAHIEAKLKKFEERLERKKAEYAGKMKNEAALIHKEAEEKRAILEAKRGEEILKTEEMAAKYRATGKTPKTSIGCVG